MLMEILLTVWLGVALLGIISIILEGVLVDYEIGEVLYCISRVIACVWVTATILAIFGFMFYLVWS